MFYTNELYMCEESLPKFRRNLLPPPFVLKLELMQSVVYALADILQDYDSATGVSQTEKISLARTLNTAVSPITRSSTVEFLLRS